MRVQKYVFYWKILIQIAKPMSRPVRFQRHFGSNHLGRRANPSYPSSQSNPNRGVEMDSIPIGQQPFVAEADSLQRGVLESLNSGASI
jgi:hypothetical protein